MVDCWYEEKSLLPSSKWRTWNDDYFLGIGGVAECRWKISLGQGKYTVEILKSLGWWTARPWPTYGIEPEAIEWCFIRDGDATMYRQMIGSLMYMMNTETRHLLCCEHLWASSWQIRDMSLDCCKAYSEVPEGTIDYGSSMRRLRY